MISGKLFSVDGEGLKRINNCDMPTNQILDIMPVGNLNTKVQNVASYVLHLIIGLFCSRANKPAATS